MCKQIYLYFPGCGCQLRYFLEECEYGRADPRCHHLRHATKTVRRGSRCHYHLWSLKQIDRARADPWTPWPTPAPVGLPVVTAEDRRRGLASWW